MKPALAGGPDDNLRRSHGSASRTPCHRVCFHSSLGKVTEPALRTEGYVCTNQDFACTLCGKLRATVSQVNRHTAGRRTSGSRRTRPSHTQVGASTCCVCKNRQTDNRFTGPGLTGPGLTGPGFTSPGFTSPGLTGPGGTARTGYVTDQARVPPGCSRECQTTTDSAHQHSTHRAMASAR